MGAEQPALAAYLAQENFSLLTEEEHDYLVVDTKHGVCVIHAESCHCRLDTLGIYVVDNKDTTYVIKKK